jgi:hypothetical protein
LGSGFFEFLDERGHSQLYNELKEDKVYEVVMTTAGGLYRYRAGDSVRCHGYVGDLPILRFAGRCGIFSDFVGEKLSDAFVSECMERAGLSGILIPIAEPKIGAAGCRPYYLLLIEEPGGDDLHRLEEELCRNPQYAYAIKMRQLRPLRAKHVPGLAKRYMEYAVSRGRRLGDIKIPALCTDAEWKEEIDA